MMNFEEYLGRDSDVGKAIRAFPPKVQADLNRFVQNSANLAGDKTKTGEQRIAEALSMEKEMQKKMKEKYANNDNK